MKITDDTGVIEALVLEAFRAGGQGKLAERLGMSPSMMSGIITRKRPIPESVLRHVGFERRTVYVKTAQQKPGGTK